MNIKSQSEVRLSKLTNFYHDNPKYYDIFKSIVNKEYTISLRLIDYFVTTYAKKHNTVIGDDFYVVYAGYKNQLKGYKKTMCDPFSRKYKDINIGKFLFKHPNGNIETTVGQLNFFMWALSTGIVAYLEKHYNEIAPLLSRSTKKNSKKLVPQEQLMIKARKSDNNTIIVSGLI